MRSIGLIILILFVMNVIITSVSCIKFDTSEVAKIPEQTHKKLDRSTALQQQALGPTANTGQTASKGPIVRDEAEEEQTTPKLSQTQSSQTMNALPIVIDSFVIDNRIDTNHSCNLDGVLVRARNIGTKQLDDIDIYLIVPEPVTIINCSYPVISSSIEEALRYDRLTSKALSKEDISNPKQFAKKIMGKDKHSLEIQKYFSEKDREILNNSSLQNENTLENILLCGLNKLIRERKSGISTSFEHSKNSIYALQTKKLLKLNNTSSLGEIDHCLMNLFQLRDLYPSFLRKPDGSMQIHENFILDNETGYIHIKLPSLKPKDNLMFVYYANITTPGVYKATIMAATSNANYSDLYDDVYDDIYLAYYTPQLDVSIDLSELEATPGEGVTLKYLIDLVSPINRSSYYSFQANIEDSDKKNIIINKTDYNLLFSKNNTTCELPVVIKFISSGSYSIPSIEIGTKKYLAKTDKYIEVEDLWHKYIPELSLIFLALCTIIASNLPRFFKNRNYQFLLVAMALLAAIFLIILLEIPNIYALVIFIPILFIFLYSMLELNKQFEKENESKP
jgi:hypothetical protein